MRPIRVLQRGTHGFVPTDAAALFVGTQIDERTILDPTDTVLDPEICRQGGWIDLPGGPYTDYAFRPIKEIYYPAFDHQREGRVITLNRMAISANRLMRVIQSFQEGTSTKEAVQKAIRSYQYEAVRGLGGKSGILNSNVISSRVKNSARAVLVVHGSRSPEFIGIPVDVMKKLHLEEGSLVILGREPTIWGGSIEVLRAKGCRSSCFEVHPLIFKQLGADCDGDTIWVYKVPTDPDCQKEAEEQILGFASNFAKWPAYLRISDESDYVDWDLDVAEQTKQRARVTGFSVSPKEIIENGPRMQHLCKVMGKDVAAECLDIVNGLTPEAYKIEVERQNVALVNMKLGMGPIGAMANRLRLFAGMDKGLLESASYVSERLQQTLLDTKHWIGRKDGYSIQDALDMLNRREAFEKAHLEDAIGVLEKMGMNADRVRPIMTWLWLQYPMIMAVREIYPGLPPSRMSRMVAYIRDYEKEGDIRKMLQKIITCGGSTHKATEEEIVKKHFTFAKGLSEICKGEYPVATLMSDTTVENRELAMGLAHAVFGRGMRDAHGVTKFALEEAMHVSR